MFIKYFNGRVEEVERKIIKNHKLKIKNQN